MRFVRDCEAWFGKPVLIGQSPLRSVENVIMSCGYIKSGKGGAACTKRLKRAVRKGYEAEHPGPMIMVWGLDAGEKDRADRLQDTMPDHRHLFPLIDANMTKLDAHGYLARAGIKRPAMYDLGYHNNNCIGCVKGGMGYWNKIRVDFPGVFAARARLERTVGFAILGQDIWLDELDPERGRHDGPICESCGIMCEIAFNEDEKGAEQ
jgi:hypothetical protein